MAVRVLSLGRQDERLSSALLRLGSNEARRELNQVLGAGALARVGLEFESSTDPYGKTWKPVGRDGSALRDTGRLNNSFHYGAATGNFRLDTDVIYAATHQYGAIIRPKNGKLLWFKLPFATQVFSARGAKLKRRKVMSQWVAAKKVTIPQRQMVPEGDIGPIWFGDFDTAVTEFLQQHLKT